MSEERILPYSYHTFVYPFSFEDIEKLNINDVGIWKQEPFDIKDKEFNTKLDNASQEEKDKYRLQYGAYQYFFPKAQKNMFNVKDSEDISTLYEYIFNKEASTFTISKGNKNIELRIEAIRVNIFTRLQVGVVSFELEYYPTEEQNHFEDALFINAFGRRLFPPYLVQPETKLPTADTIEVVLIQSKNIEPINYKKKNNEFNDEPTLIRKLLTDSEEKEVISPILDDRMFVMSLVRDERLSDSNNLKRIWSNIKKFGVEKEEDSSIAEKIYIDSTVEKLYKFLFVDDDFCTCQNDEMLRQKLQDHLYPRWINYGTIHGITEYSMVCVTGTSQKDTVDSVINPFLVHYTEMVKLALIQRASLVKLETEISKICTIMSSREDGSKNQENKNSNFDQSISKNIQDIWKDYILFQNQILLPEITFQEQGIELYQMLKRDLKIEVMNEYIGSILNNLHEMSSMENSEVEKRASEKLNQSLNLLAVLGTILALISVAQDYLGEDIDVFVIVKYFLGFLFVLGPIWFGYKIFMKLSDTERGNKRKVWFVILWIITLLVPFLMSI